MAEIAKCDIVCANCHRIRTIERGTPWEYWADRTKGSSGQESFDF